MNWLKTRNPDVVCLQELKVEEAKYPREALAELGYVSAINAQKTYNGVAILSKEPLTNVQVGMADGSVRNVSGTVSQATWSAALLPTDDVALGNDW